MDLGLSQQVAVVFGAANGIGLAVARRFEEEGAICVWIDRDEKLPSVIAEHSIGTDVLSLCVDAVEEPHVQSTVDSIWDQYGQIDHVVNAIGVGSGKFGEPFWKLRPADWLPVLEGNLLTAVNIAHAAAPRMSERRRGTFSFLSSVAGQVGSPTDPPYSAAKAALINFVQCAARDFAKFEIRANAFCPGMVKTTLNRGVWEAWGRASTTNTLSYDEWAMEKLKRIAPLGRWQEPDEVAAAIAYVASHHGRNITGQTINIDGGQVMHS